MNNKAIKCLHHGEFIDRLIDNGFHFKVEEELINNAYVGEACPLVERR